MRRLRAWQSRECGPLPPPPASRWALHPSCPRPCPVPCCCIRVTADTWLDWARKNGSSCSLPITQSGSVWGFVHAPTHPTGARRGPGAWGEWWAEPTSSTRVTPACMWLSRGPSSALVGSAVELRKSQGCHVRLRVLCGAGRLDVGFGRPAGRTAHSFGSSSMRDSLCGCGLRHS